MFADEFLLVVALMDVTDMAAIEDAAFSTGFVVFDQVKISCIISYMPVMLKIFFNNLLQDKDGLLTTSEAEVVVRLFLPMSAQQTDCFVSQLVAKMADGGKTISADHFEKSVREAGKSLPAEH